MKKNKIIISLIIGGLVIFGLVVLSQQFTANSPAMIVVNRNTITEKAVAIGRIVPQQSITVTSTIPGTVARLLHEEGDAVSKGNALLEIKPNPRPIDLDRARRELQQKQVAEQTAQTHLERFKQLIPRHYVTQDEFEKVDSEYKTAVLQRQLAEESLALLEHGRTMIAGQPIQSVVISPIDGFILARYVDVGDPVVPQTESQNGNILFTIANMKDLIFKGQVSEMDVAKIHPGMPAEITIGSFPEQKIKGVLYRLALQSAQSANSAVNASDSKNSPFHVSFEIIIKDLQIPADMNLRVGYSANAEIMIKTARQVLAIPERVVEFEGKKTYVWLYKDGNEPKKQEIKLGIADGINVEVLSGLVEGSQVLEQNPSKTNSADADDA